MLQPQRFTLALSLFVLTLAAQSDSGELRLAVRDTAGGGVPATIELANQSTSTRENVTLANDGIYIFRALPFGTYRLAVQHPGFAAHSELIEIRSRVPVSREI